MILGFGTPKFTNFFFEIAGFVIKSFSPTTHMAIINKMISDEKANTGERLLRPFVQLQMSGLLRLTSNKKALPLLPPVRPSHPLGLPKETLQPPLQPKVRNQI